MVREAGRAAIVGLMLLAQAGAGGDPATGQPGQAVSADPAAAPAQPADPPVAAQPPTTQPAPAPAHAFALPAGVKIDQARRRVMVSCRSLHPGMPLELIACTPNTREHEAVLLVGARPQGIHLALLLCGYWNGRPARWDEKTEQPILPTGCPVEVQVQWVDPKTGKQRTVPIEDWLATVDPARRVPKLTFLFTGSQLFEDGRYWADLEGSVISVANFSDAVLDLPGEHSSDNALLEFKSNERTMPPADTPCTMILLPPARMTVAIEAGGKLAAWGHEITLKGLAAALKTHRQARDDARVELIVSPGAKPDLVDQVVALCRQADFDPDRIARSAPPPPATQPAQ